MSARKTALTVFAGYLLISTFASELETKFLEKQCSPSTIDEGSETLALSCQPGS